MKLWLWVTLMALSSHALEMDLGGRDLTKTDISRLQRNGVTFTVTVCVDARAEVRRDGRRVLETGFLEVVEKRVNLRAGDIVTVCITTEGTSGGFAALFEKQGGKVRIETDSATWFEYTPLNPKRWWDVDGLTQEDLKPATRSSATLGKERLAARKHSVKEGIWGSGKTTIYLLHTVTFDELRGSE